MQAFPAAPRRPPPEVPRPPTPEMPRPHSPRGLRPGSPTGRRGRRRRRCPRSAALPPRIRRPGRKEPPPSTGMRPPQSRPPGRQSAVAGGRCAPSPPGSVGIPGCRTGAAAAGAGPVTAPDRARRHGCAPDPPRGRGAGGQGTVRRPVPGRAWTATSRGGCCTRGARRWACAASCRRRPRTDRAAPPHRPGPGPLRPVRAAPPCG